MNKKIIKKSFLFLLSFALVVSIRPEDKENKKADIQVLQDAHNSQKDAGQKVEQQDQGTWFWIKKNVSWQGIFAVAGIIGGILIMKINPNPNIFSQQSKNIKHDTAFVLSEEALLVKENLKQFDQWVTSYIQGCSECAYVELINEKSDSGAALIAAACQYITSVGKARESESNGSTLQNGNQKDNQQMVANSKRAYEACLLNYAILHKVTIARTVESLRRELFTASYLKY